MSEKQARAVRLEVFTLTAGPNRTKEIAALRLADNREFNVDIIAKRDDLNYIIGNHFNGREWRAVTIVRVRYRDYIIQVHDEGEIATADYNTPYGVRPEVQGNGYRWSKIEPVPKATDTGMLAGGTFLEKIDREAKRYEAIKGDDDLNAIGSHIRELYYVAKFNDAKDAADLADKVEAREEARRKERTDSIRGYVEELRSNLEDVLNDD